MFSYSLFSTALLATLALNNAANALTVDVDDEGEQEVLQ